MVELYFKLKIIFSFVMIAVVIFGIIITIILNNRR